MSADLFSERFYSLREVAWHGLGQVFQEPVTAVVALDTIGNYDVHKVNLLFSDTGQDVGKCGIVREPTNDDPQRRVFGVVSPDYSLITPMELARMWDQRVNRPIETMGALGRGEHFFVTTKLDDYDIKGDPVENYLMTINSMTGGDAARLVISPVRTVCRNTLNAAEHLATDTFVLPPSPSRKETTWKSKRRR